MTVRAPEPAPDGAGALGRGLARVALAAAMALIATLAFSPVVPAGIAGIWDKLQHAAAFLTVALLLDVGFPRLGLWWKALLALSYGVFIEAVQFFLPWREASIADVLADLVGIGAHSLLLRPLLVRMGLVVRSGGARPGTPRTG